MMVSNAFIFNSWFSLRNEMVCDLMLSFTAAFAKKWEIISCHGAKQKGEYHRCVLPFLNSLHFIVYRRQLGHE